MILFFGLVVIFGMLLIVIDFGAKYASVAPSQWRGDLTTDGLMLMGIGTIGIGCVWWAGI